MTYQFNPTLVSYTPAAVNWTDTISANSNLDKTIFVGLQYRTGTFWVRGVNTFGVSSGPSNVNGIAGKIRASSSSTDYSSSELLAGVYSSSYSRQIDGSLSARMFNSSSIVQTISLIDVYFDGSGNVNFRWNNSDGSNSRAMSVYVGVNVYP